MIVFNNEEKCKAFDAIASYYYSGNFGSMSKSDFETLLFSEYLDHCMANSIPYDDYSLSKELGITQNRIRSLKERKALKYPYVGIDWKKDVAELVKNAKYDKTDHLVKFIIQDITVMNEVRHYIEEHGWFDECSLNKKLLRIPLDCFVDVFVVDEDIYNCFSQETKKIVNSIKYSDDSVLGFLKDFSKDGFKSFLMGASKEAILAVLPCLPFGGVAKTAFSYLEKVMKGS